MCNTMKVDNRWKEEVNLNYLYTMHEVYGIKRFDELSDWELTVIDNNEDLYDFYLMIRLGVIKDLGPEKKAYKYNIDKDINTRPYGIYECIFTPGQYEYYKESLFIDVFKAYAIGLHECQLFLPPGIGIFNSVDLMKYYKKEFNIIPITEEMRKSVYLCNNYSFIDADCYTKCHNIEVRRGCKDINDENKMEECKMSEEKYNKVLDILYSNDNYDILFNIGDDRYIVFGKPGIIRINLRDCRNYYTNNNIVIAECVCEGHNSKINDIMETTLDHNLKELCRNSLVEME